MKKLITYVMMNANRRSGTNPEPAHPTLPQHHPKQWGQAVVEFALASTMIFFLLAAVVDLGLIYFTLQALRVAAQEGAVYGSYPHAVKDTDGNITELVIPYAEIANRVYWAAGDQGNGFANLRDLDGNGVNDDVQSPKLYDQDSVATDPNGYIYVENLSGFDTNDLQPSCVGDERGRGLQAGGSGCWIRVTVRYEYRFFFPFAPVFGNTVRLQASHLMPMRSQYYTTP
ncbi:TadE family protein [Candidatus Chloroploca sp. Khr17]|uniref:TadE family protein n=1 Tax=Candidatus Chloroploca sp. Khr17 TaxID=2496869 RepID=UPI001F0F0B35|nr:TadE family protein [Candidatus Chloroploca sp. Khr17]